MEAKVSVIVPIYNLEDYIDRCIESIIKQTYTNLEIILVNDGSFDSSLEKCKKWAATDERIVVFEQTNRGVSAARNLGLDKSTGKYVTFVDGDDYIHNNYIKELISGFIDNKVIFSYCNSCVSCADKTNLKLSDSVEQINEFMYLQRLLLGKSPEQGACAKLFNREKIGDIRFIEGKKYHEDTYFSFLYLINNQGKISHFISDLYVYYMRETSASHREFSIDNLSEIYFADHMLSLINEKAPKISEYAGYHYISARLSILKNIIRSNCLKEHLALCKKIRKEVVLCNYKTDFYKIRKLELFSLKIGLRFYKLTVLLFDFF